MKRDVTHNSRIKQLEAENVELCADVVELKARISRLESVRYLVDPSGTITQIEAKPAQWVPVPKKPSHKVQFWSNRMRWKFWR